MSNKQPDSLEKLSIYLAGTLTLVSELIFYVIFFCMFVAPFLALMFFFPPSIPFVLYAFYYYYSKEKKGSNEHKEDK